MAGTKAQGAGGQDKTAQDRVGCMDQRLQHASPSPARRSLGCTWPKNHPAASAHPDPVHGTAAIGGCCADARRTHPDRGPTGDAGIADRCPRGADHRFGGGHQFTAGHRPKAAVPGQQGDSASQAETCRHGCSGSFATSFGCARRQFVEIDQRLGFELFRPGRRGEDKGIRGRLAPDFQPLTRRVYCGAPFTVLLVITILRGMGRAPVSTQSCQSVSKLRRRGARTRPHR